MLCLTASQESSFSNTNHASAHPATTRSHVDAHRFIGRCERLTTTPGQEKEGSRVMTHHGQQTCSAIPFSGPTAPAHHRGDPQWRWSASVCEGGPSLIVVLKKSKTRPEPPRRSSSLPSSGVSSKSSLKRHSCPPDSLCPPLASPPPSPASSAPIIRTSVITGSSPLGCKMRPKPTRPSPRARLARLSLQLPPPTSALNLSPNPAPGCDSASSHDPANPSAMTKPPPKPSRRRHSESSAFLRSLATPQPLVTQKDLSAVELRPVFQCSNEPDSVLIDEEERREKVVPQGRKVPPPVAAKTAESKWRSYFLAESLPLPGQAPANQEEPVYTTVRKPTTELNSQHEDHSKKVPTGLDGQCHGLSGTSSGQSDASCRDRVSAPLFKVRAPARVHMEMKRRSLPPSIPPKPQIDLQAWLCMNDPTEREAMLSWLKSLSLAQED